MESRLAHFTFLMVSVTIVGYLLIIARSLLVPLIFAVFIWYILNTAANSLIKAPRFGHYIPRWLALLASVCVLFYLGYWLADMIRSNVNQVITLAPQYQERFMVFLNNLDARLSIKLVANLTEWINDISLQNTLVSFYGVFTSFTSNLFLIALYVIFLFLEQQVMRPKLVAIFDKKNHLKLAEDILAQIANDTETYVSIKTFLSFFTALSCWFLMRLVGLDFSEFWAILIFFLNFIPNIGPVVSTFFPIMLSLIQFPPNWWPVVIIIAGTSSIQFIVGNIVEPKLMGKHLNLSPLVILVTLAVWGQIWGVVGMFLSVPMTVIMMIVFSNFEKTKPIAILLSEDGLIT